MSRPEKRPIRLLVVDPHEMVRLGLRAILGSCSHIEVVGEAATKSAAVADTIRLKPDVVLLEVRLPDGSGFEVCREIHRQHAILPVLFLTSFADDELVFEAINAGAAGYLLKDIDGPGLAGAIENVVAGKSILDPVVTRQVLQRMKALAERPAQGAWEQLSSQEQRVIALVAEGKTNKEIAVAMRLSDKTVKNYLSNILEKLQLTRRTQAAAFYVQHHKA